MSAVDENPTTEIPSGRLIQIFLSENKDGATVSEIQQHLRKHHNNAPAEEVNKLVETILDKGASLGFLERKGSHYMNWLAREMCCKRRRKSRCRRRRKRCNRRRRSRRRKRCRC